MRTRWIESSTMPAPTLAVVIGGIQVWIRLPDARACWLRGRERCPSSLGTASLPIWSMPGLKSAPWFPLAVCPFWHHRQPSPHVCEQVFKFMLCSSGAW